MDNFSKLKYVIYRLLVWCAGSNLDILENKARFSNEFICGKSEQIKHAWTGALVLIPPTLSFFGMLYAAATLDVPQVAVMTIAMLWTGVVFILERYIVCSFRKSESIRHDLISVTFIVRLFFSIGVGFAISDPLIHGIFNKSIEKKLSEINRTEVDNIKAKSLALIAIKDDDKRARHNQLIAKNDSIAKYDTKITNEIDGLIGKSSGVIGDGPSAQEKKEIRERMLKEWHLLNYQDSIKNISIDSDITKIKNDTEKIIKSKKYSNDYLAQRHTGWRRDTAASAPRPRWAKA